MSTLDLDEWHLWFAWRPVTLLTMEIAWLRWVLRRPRGLGPEHPWSKGQWQYANPVWVVKLDDRTARKGLS